MKTKLLKKFRKRFKFTNVHGYSEMIDTKTNIVYGPEWRYCRSRYSVEEYNVTIALKILTGEDRWQHQELRKANARYRTHHNQILKAIAT
jgi:hypothetical protein